MCRSGKDSRANLQGKTVVLTYMGFDARYRAQESVRIFMHYFWREAGTSISTVLGNQ